jgi:hypothetical protein
MTLITVLEEITDWEYPSGMYHVNGNGALVGYQPSGGEYKEFINPMKKFSQSRRKFRTLRTRPDTSVPEGTTWVVKGSKDASYVVSDIEGKLSCTCPGFKFRHVCKHTK